MTIQTKKLTQEYFYSIDMKSLPQEIEDIVYNHALSTERMINWINTVEEKDPSRRIEIEDIERKGNVVYVHCAIKSIIKP